MRRGAARARGVDAQTKGAASFSCIFPGHPIISAVSHQKTQVLWDLIPSTAA